MAKPRTIFRQEPITRTIVVVDLARSTTIVKSLQTGQQMGAIAAKFVKDQIEDLVREATALSGADFKSCFVRDTGDGALLQFEGEVAADQFAVAFQQHSYKKHCQSAERDVEWRSFRVGIYTGDVVLHPHDISGAVVGDATRLETGARTGQIVIDADSWAKLSVQRQASYGPEERLQLRSKPHESVFKVHRCQVVESAPWEREKREAPEEPGLFELTLNLTIADVDQQKVEAIVALLRELAKDPYLTLRRVDKGSVKLLLEGSRDGFEHLKALIEEGTLAQQLGISVMGLNWLPGSDKGTVWYLPDRDRNRNFIGRTAEIESVRDVLLKGRIGAFTEAIDIRSTKRISALVGLGGIGKTQTAIEYAFQFADKYEYIFFVHADDAGKIQRDYADIAELLKLHPWEKGLQGLVQIVLEWMSENSGWLLILDNVDKEEQVAPYLPKKAKGHILLTSRLKTLDLLGAVNPIPIGLFTPEESRVLLTARGRATNGNPAEEEALMKLVRGMGGLPVALEQAATYIRKLPCTFADYWQEFNQTRTKLFIDPLSRLGKYQHEGILFKKKPDEGIADRDKAIATTWDINFRRVRLEANKLPGTPHSAAPDLLLVSAFLSPDDIPMDLLAAGAAELGPVVTEALSGGGRLSVNEALHLLHQFSLIEIKLENRAYSMHRLVQEVVRKVWMTPEQRILWGKRVIGVLRLGTNILQASLGNFPDALKDQHFASFVATVLLDEWKQKDFEFEEAAELLSQTGFLLTMTVQFKDADIFLKRALAIREKLLGPDHLDVAETVTHFANNLADWKHYTEALPYYERALRIRTLKLPKDHPDIAQVHNDLGIAYFHLHDYSLAKKHYREALRIWRKGHDENLIGTAFFGLAMVFQNEFSEEKEAEEHFRKAHEKITVAHMRAHACRCYGDFLAGEGRDAEALPLLREGRKLAKRRFGEESERILEHNASLRSVLESLGLKEELKEIERESKKIRERVSKRI